MRFSKAWRWVMCSALLGTWPLGAVAGGARWYTGPPFYTASEGQPVVFFTPEPLYYTDAGDLAASVSHAQADAMVAAAAAVWNVPTSRLTLAQGGTLAEHVSGGNTFFDGTQVVWPDDVQGVNYRAKPIAIVYDTDGSVIDTLLGSGASETVACRQNGVVESVDGLSPDGTIHHALLILNGRCVGANADQLTQMRYQLTRAFGRIIGLAWSQLNDNVFTGTPTPTLAQALNWPLMHPIDVICGPYTFKCMAQPFTLRADDLSALALLYPVTAANLGPGKTLTAEDGLYVDGRLRFPTGQGMDAVNVVVTRQPAASAVEGAEIVSAVSGMGFQQFAGNPVTGAASGAAESNGKSYPDAENSFVMQRIPLPGGIGYSLYYRAEAINPLYTGAYAIGPYVGTPASISGPGFAFVDAFEFGGRYAIMDETLPQAATSCNPGNDGVESAPAVADVSGFWSGLLCGPRHTSWWSQSVQAGRTWTVEVTAVDENGVVSTSKARPLLGVWNATDARGTTPTVALTRSAFNAQALGMTQLKLDAGSAATGFRIAVADDRGHGRPDFGYKMRVLYADSLVPAQLGTSGGRITITGEGFRSGNRVTVNGVAATVVSWSANTIVATAPTRSAAHMTATGSADVAVTDASTGGSTVIRAALSYGGTATNVITLISAPSQLEAGVASATSFAVRVTAADGVTPMVAAAVRFAATGVAAAFAACGGATCTLTTDASGYAQSAVTASAAGTLALTATELSGGAVVQASVTVSEPVRLIALVSAPAQVDTNAASSAPLVVRVTLSDGATPVGAANVQFAITSGAGSFTVCSATTCVLTTDTNGYARAAFAASAAGTLVLTAKEASGGATVQANITVSDPVRLIALVSAPSQVDVGTASLTPFRVLVTAADGVTPVVGATVRFSASDGTAAFAACGGAVCALVTDANGYARSTVTAGVAGTLRLSATVLSGGAEVHADVTVVDPVRSILLVSAPSQSQTGVVTTIPFAVRVTMSDGVTPVAGASVRLAVVSGAAAFAACGVAICTLTTDASGYARSVFTSSAEGTLVLSATELSRGGTVQVSVAVSDPARLIALVSAPSQLQTGAPSATPFAVRVTAADGVTPIAMASVRFAVTAGSGVLAACGAAACTVTTDSAGYAASAITASAAGTLVVTATELKNGAVVQPSVAVSAPMRAVAIVGATRYLAAGASAQWMLSLAASQDGMPAAGVPVTWSAGAGLYLGDVSGVTDAAGSASVSVLTPGLAAGAQASVQGCVWSTVCTVSSVVGVGAAEWTLTAAGGANQIVTAGDALSSVMLRVTDASGHALEGAGVTVYQTVTAWQGMCVGRGRCSAAPVLASTQTTAMSGADGSVTVTPMEMPGVASVVHIAAVTGTRGFVSVELTKVP